MRVVDAGDGWVRAISASVSPTCPHPRPSEERQFSAIFDGRGPIQHSSNENKQQSTSCRMMRTIGSRYWTAIGGYSSNSTHIFFLNQWECTATQTWALRQGKDDSTINSSGLSCRRITNGEMGAFTAGIGSSKVHHKHIMG